MAVHSWLMRCVIINMLIDQSCLISVGLLMVHQWLISRLGSLCTIDLIIMFDVGIHDV